MHQRHQKQQQRAKSVQNLDHHVNLVHDRPITTLQKVDHERGHRQEYQQPEEEVHGPSERAGSESRAEADVERVVENAGDDVGDDDGEDEVAVALGHCAVEEVRHL